MVERFVLRNAFLSLLSLKSMRVLTNRMSHSESDKREFKPEMMTSTFSNWPFPFLPNAIRFICVLFYLLRSTHSHNAQRNGTQSSIRALAFTSKGKTSFYGHYQTLTRLLHAIPPPHCWTRPITPRFFALHRPIFSLASISLRIQPSHQAIIQFFN